MQDHARGRIVPLEDGDEVRHDLNALFASFEHEVPLPEQMLVGDTTVNWGPRWQCSRRVVAGDGAGVLEIELAEEFRGDLERYFIHPTILDVGASIGTLLAGEAFLPLAYRRIRYRQRFPARVFTYFRRTDEDLSPRDIIHFDLLLLDEDGRELMAIEGFTMKRIVPSMWKQKQSATPPAAEKAKGLHAAGGMLSREGVEAFRRALSLARTPQVAVAQRDLIAAIAAFRTADRSRIMERAGGARAQQASYPRPDLPNPYVAPTGELESKLAEVWQAALGIERVGVHDNFFDLGGDSVLGVQMISRCAEAGLQLSPEQLFEHQTIAELANVLGSAPEAETVAAEPVDLSQASLSQSELDKVFSSLERMTS
jgi:aryl carrier-like protein